MAESQNGWRVLSADETKKWVVPGTGRHLVLAPWSPGFLLVHFALWFHEKVEPLGGGEWDEWGWANRPIRGSSTISNHASGTAMDLNAVDHPLGVRGTFTPSQVRRIRRRLRLYRGCIRWGGDYQSRADEMHFEINADRAKVKAVAKVLRATPRGRRVRKAN